jgi:hypothetical protein
VIHQRRKHWSLLLIKKGDFNGYQQPGFPGGHRMV